LDVFARFEKEFLFLFFGQLSTQRWRVCGDRGQEDESKNKPSPHFPAHAKQMASLVQVAGGIEVHVAAV
jgi:hypothetical protein